MKPHRAPAVRGLAILAPAALLLGGCTGAPTPAPASTLEPADALTTYSRVQEDLVAALGGRDLWEVADGNLSGDDGTCTLVLPRATTPRELATGGTLDDVAAAVDPVLDDHGFSALSEADAVDGGAIEADAGDDAGAVVTISSEQTSRLQLTVPVDPSGCDGDGAFPLPGS